MLRSRRLAQAFRSPAPTAAETPSVGAARPSYISTSAITCLANAWLHLNPGTSRRRLAQRLAPRLARRRVRVGIDTLQRVLGGHQPLARREIRDALLEALAERGLSSPEAVRAFLGTRSEQIRQSMRARTLEPGSRFRSLAWAYKIATRNPSSRHLAGLLRRRLAARGAGTSLYRIQELIDGSSRTKVRHVIVEEMEALLRSVLPGSQSVEEALMHAEQSTTMREDLSWVDADSAATLAKRWLARNPDGSLRKLAIAVADTARTLGYRTTHHTIQPILAGRKRRTRGFVYRALLQLEPEARERESPRGWTRRARRERMHPHHAAPDVKRGRPARHGATAQPARPAPPAKPVPSRPLITLAPGQLLDRETERELARRWRREGDRDAANLLVEANLRYVAKLAGHYRGYGVETADLIAEGTLGLFEALRYFDPDRGLRFLTYAGHWVRKCMLEYLLRSSGVVSVRRGQPEARMFFALRKEQAALESQAAGDRSQVHEALATRFATSETRVREFSHRLSRGDVSLDAPVRVDDERRPMDRLRDVGDDPERAASRSQEAQLVHEACATLEPRERAVVHARLLSDPEERESLEQVGRRLGLSRERVRQIELRASRKLRTVLAPVLAPPGAPAATDADALRAS